MVFSEALPFLSDWFSIILNVCFNILALGLAINPIFIGSYSVTLPLIVICLNCTQKIIENSSEIAQVSRAKMMQSLLSGWDSIFVGNRWNLNNWRKIFHDKHNKARETSLCSILLVEITTSISLILSLVPIIGSLVWLIVTQHHNYSLLTALVATLPRQITTIQYMSDIVSYSAQWNSVKTRLHGVAKSLKLPENSEQFIGNISWGEIYAQNGTTVTPIFSLEDLEKITKGFGPGRITIRGRNGSGKSSLIALLKEKFGDNSFLLPSHSDLIFLSSYGKSLSTGEKMILILDEIKNDVKTNLLLLDEWDANLDHSNIGNISQKIKVIAKNICVIEVRHRE